MTQIELHGFNWTDYTIVGIISVSALISIVRGFVREALSLVAWLVAAWVALTFAKEGAQYFVGFIAHSTIRLIVAFIVIFISMIIVGAIVNWLIAKLVSSTGLSGTDRLLGGIFGIARGILIVSIMVLLVQMSVLSQATWFTQSQLIVHLQPMAEWLQQRLPDSVQQIIHTPSNSSPHSLEKITKLPAWGLLSG